MKVGFVGVGAMGAAMAGHVAKAGHDVLAYDTDTDMLSAAAVGGVAPAGTIGDIATSCEVVIVVVSTDEQSRSVVGALLEAGPVDDQVIVVAATNHPATMILLNTDCANRGVGFVDAPVCYGLKGAIDGDLVSLCGGAAEDIGKITPILMPYSRSVEYMGPVDTGQLGKSCNNIMHWAACVANFETLFLAKPLFLFMHKIFQKMVEYPPETPAPGHEDYLPPTNI